MSLSRRPSLPPSPAGTPPAGRGRADALTGRTADGLAARTGDTASGWCERAYSRIQNEDPSINSGQREERAFWAEQDSSEILNWKQAQRAIFPNLKPTLKSISLRLPESMIDELRQLANERDVPYQSLIKHFLRERIDQEYKVSKK